MSEELETPMYDDWGDSENGSTGWIAVGDWNISKSGWHFSPDLPVVPPTHSTVFPNMPEGVEFVKCHIYDNDSAIKTLYLTREQFPPGNEEYPHPGTYRVEFFLYSKEWILQLGRGEATITV